MCICTETIPTAEAELPHDHRAGRTVADTMTNEMFGGGLAALCTEVKKLPRLSLTHSYPPSCRENIHIHPVSIGWWQVEASISIKANIMCIKAISFTERSDKDVSSDRETDKKESRLSVNTRRFRPNMVPSTVLNFYQVPNKWKNPQPVSEEKWDVGHLNCLKLTNHFFRILIFDKLLLCWVWIIWGSSVYLKK